MDPHAAAEPPTPVQTPEEALNRVNPYSTPSTLRITDLRFTDIVGAPCHSILMKIHTNQGLVGLGEVRDGASRTYALMLKGRLLGENPCHVDRLFRRLKQFGGHARQGGGVSGVEIALWDLAGKAYGVPVYQMLGGRFRDRVRMYCDTPTPRNADGRQAGEALARRAAAGYTFLKTDVGAWQLLGRPGMLSAPLGVLDQLTSRRAAVRARPNATEDRLARFERRNRSYDLLNVQHPFTGIHITEQGLDWLEQYVAEARTAVGPELPLAIDHLGHIGLEDCIRLARRLEKYHPAWMEDPVPWQYTEHYARLQRATTVPICTGEDIYLKESFLPLLAAGGVSVVHPDVLTAGGILETRKIGDMAQDHGVAMAIHMAESPVACMAAAHVATATDNFLALEFHAADVPWWEDIVTGPGRPRLRDGYIEVSEHPGLGIEDYNDEVLREHRHPAHPELWGPTTQWDDEWAHDRLWS
ncbi:MAG: mandelate racemase/muconate lactonizing enzyme family protein [Lentisphaeria bacterium]|nr:mandelate racemase/muconate lactonizing enzyme family protein [Lentisphaeria bacterium]